MKSTKLLGALGAALDARFNDATRPPLGGVPGPVEFRPGLNVPALDNWGTCSMLWVTAGRRWRSQTFPVSAEGQRCEGGTVLEVTVGVARCSNALGELGDPPTVEHMAQEMDVQEDDKDRLEAAVCSALNGLRRDLHVTDWARGPVDTIGPEGGTVAVFITLTAAMAPSGLSG